MERKRFTEEQIIAVLREHEAGAKAGDLVRNSLRFYTSSMAIRPVIYEMSSCAPRTLKHVERPPDKLEAVYRYEVAAEAKGSK